VKAIPEAWSAPLTASGNRGSRAVEATAEQTDAASVGDKWAAGSDCMPAPESGAIDPAPNRWRNSRRTIATRFQ